MKIPLVRPAPPQLSLAVAELQSLEQSGVFTNFGPVNTLFEQEMLDRFFGGKGACMTVCNATIGLMLAIKEAVGEQPAGKFALMPGFTFAAAAHAALWCGLTPLLCDIDPENWAADPAAEAEMLARYAGKIAVVMPYATFGYPIDLERYTRLAHQLGVPVVVDAAASLGTFDEQGRGFGSGFSRKRRVFHARHQVVCCGRGGTDLQCGYGSYCQDSYHEQLSALVSHARRPWLA